MTETVIHFHVHGVCRDRDTGEELATVTVTIDAEDDADAQTRAWELFQDDYVQFDVTEIEVAE